MTEWRFGLTKKMRDRLAESLAAFAESVCGKTILSCRRVRFRPTNRNECFRFRNKVSANSRRSAFIVCNLAPAKAIGMTTLWVDNGSEQAEDADRDHIDFATCDVTHWLHEILEEA